MLDFLMYVVVAIVIVGCCVGWFLHRDTPNGRRAALGAIVGIISILVMLSSKRRIPFVGGIVDWFKDRFADGQIADLDKDIEELEKKQLQALLSADELKKEAEVVRAKAEKHREKANALKKLVDSKIKHIDDDVMLEDAPEKTGDAVADAKAILDILRKQRSLGAL